jgi:hypothetical protein
MNWSQAIFPSLKRRGGRAINKMNPFRSGVDGVVSSAECSGLKVFAELTTNYGFALSRSRFAPVCAE